MDYKELKKIVNLRGLRVEKVSVELGYNRQGLKRAMDSETIPYSRIRELCKIVGITPNEFFDVDENQIVGVSPKKELEIRQLIDQFEAELDSYRARIKEIKKSQKGTKKK